MERLSFKEWQVLSDLEVLDSIPEDFEFSMARGELKTIKRSVDRIMKHLGGEGDLEAWVQSKITKANDYLNSVSNHMDGGEDDTKKEVKEAKCDCDCGKVPCVECGTDHHKKELKEEKCGDGMYYCKSSKKCKKIPKGYRVGKDGMLVKGVRWQDSDGDGKWYEPGDDVSEGSNPSFDINPKAKKVSERDKKLQNRADSGGVEGEIAAKMLQKKGKGPSLPGRQQDMRKKLNEGAVEDLEKGMETLKSITYDSIDGLMKRIAEDYDISTTKLHYMFKAKHDMTPDDWAEKNLKEEMSNWRQDLDEKCWKGYEKKGMKTMFGKRYPNCVKKEEVEQIQEKPGDGYLGPTMKVGNSEIGLPNPVRLTQDASDIQARRLTRDSANYNKTLGRNATSVIGGKTYNRKTSTAYNTLFGKPGRGLAQDKPGEGLARDSFEPQGEVIGEEVENEVSEQSGGGWMQVGGKTVNLGNSRYHHPDSSTYTPPSLPSPNTGSVPPPATLRSNTPAPRRQQTSKPATPQSSSGAITSANNNRLRQAQKDAADVGKATGTSGLMRSTTQSSNRIQNRYDRLRDAMRRTGTSGWDQNMDLRGNPVRNSYEPQGEVIGEEGDNKVTPINKKKRMDAKKQATKDMSKEPYDTNTARRRAKGQGILDNLLGKPPTTEEVVLEKRDGKSAKSKGYSLRDWFKGGGWVQAGGKYDGKPCAKQPGQTTKPFCRDADDRAAMTKDEREKRAAKKRREDPNPERKGKAKIVTEKSEEIRYCPKCKKPETRSDCRYGVDYWDANAKTITSESIRLGATYQAVKADNEHAKKMMDKSKVSDGMKYALKKADQRKHDDYAVRTLDTQSKKSIARADAAKYDLAKERVKREKARQAVQQKNPDAISKYNIDKAAKISGDSGDRVTTEGVVAEKKDACYHKVKSRYSVWPSAYASGALVKCRKVGAKNWGNKTKKEGYEFSDWRDDFKPTEIQSFDIVKAEPLVDVNSITEPVQLATEDYQRLQSTGNVFCIMLTWRGQPYRVQLFFPGGSRPSREEVKGEVDKLYPGAVISHYYPAPTDPTQPIVVIQR